jgi:hypothetical protein
MVEGNLISDNICNEFVIFLLNYLLHCNIPGSIIGQIDVKFEYEVTNGY